MKQIKVKIVGVAMFIFTAAFISSNATAQSCAKEKLCSTNYRAHDEYVSNDKHKDVLIIVRAVNTGYPGFLFAPGDTEQQFDCPNPKITEDGATMSCMKWKDDSDPLSPLEVVTVSAIGSQFCASLRNSKHKTGNKRGRQVIDPGDCEKPGHGHTSCACFMVEHFYSPDNPPKDPFAPSRGTGSGGSP